MLYNFLSLVIHFASNSSIVNEKVFIRSHLVCTRYIHISQYLIWIRSEIFKCTKMEKTVVYCIFLGLLWDLIYNFLSLVIHFASNSSIVNEKVFIRSHLVCTRYIHISQYLIWIRSEIFKCTKMEKTVVYCIFLGLLWDLIYFVNYWCGHHLK